MVVSRLRNVLAAFAQAPPWQPVIVLAATAAIGKGHERTWAGLNHRQGLPDHRVR